MSWLDYGVIFPVNNLEPWAQSHCYVPTALELEDRIRVYAAFWDANTYGRMGYVDVDKERPDIILGYSRQPIMPDAPKGAFDCDGVTPLSVINDGQKIRIYYAGWQKFDLPNKRYTLFTGLAQSNLAGDRFERFSSSPIIGPRNNEETVRTGGYVQFINGEWRIWYACYDSIQNINNKPTPAYSLNTIISKDGYLWNMPDKVVFPIIHNEVLGYGRSAIWQDETHLFKGLFPIRHWDGRYRGILYSESQDGLSWGNLSQSGMAFLTHHTCDQQSEVMFPSLIHQKDRIVMFYNGNDFGADGLRLAIWNKS